MDSVEFYLNFLNHNNCYAFKKFKEQNFVSDYLLYLQISSIKAITKRLSIEDAELISKILLKRSGSSEGIDFYAFKLFADHVPLLFGYNNGNYSLTLFNILSDNNPVIPESIFTSYCSSLLNFAKFEHPAFNTFRSMFKDEIIAAFPITLKKLFSTKCNLIISSHRISIIYNKLNHPYDYSIIEKLKFTNNTFNILLFSEMSVNGKTFKSSQLDNNSYEVDGIYLKQLITIINIMLYLHNTLHIAQLSNSSSIISDICMDFYRYLAFEQTGHSYIPFYENISEEKISLLSNIITSLHNSEYLESIIVPKLPTATLEKLPKPAKSFPSPTSPHSLVNKLDTDLISNTVSSIRKLFYLLHPLFYLLECVDDIGMWKNKKLSSFVLCFCLILFATDAYSYFIPFLFCLFSFFLIINYYKKSSIDLYGDVEEDINRRIQEENKKLMQSEAKKTLIGSILNAVYTPYDNLTGVSFRSDFTEPL